MINVTVSQTCSNASFLLVSGQHSEINSPVFTLDETLTCSSDPKPQGSGSEEQTTNELVDQKTNLNYIIHYCMVYNSILLLPGMTYFNSSKRGHSSKRLLVFVINIKVELLVVDTTMTFITHSSSSVLTETVCSTRPSAEHQHLQQN